MGKHNMLVLMSTHNRQLHLASALYSLNEALPTKNFVVSLSNSGEHFEELKPLGFRIEVSKVSTASYWAEAMYTASSLFFRSNEFTHVLWLNEDVILFPNSILDLLSVMSISDADIVVGQTVSDNGQISYGGFLQHSVALPLHFRRILAKKFPLKVDTFNGNVVLLGPKALSAIGPFLSGYKHYLADIAYGLEATRMGLKVFVAPGFAGHCQPNLTINPSLDTGRTRRQRIHLLNQPQGIPYRPQIRFSLRYGGVLGIVYLVSTYARFAIKLISFQKTSKS